MFGWNSTTLLGSEGLSPARASVHAGYQKGGQVAAMDMNFTVRHIEITASKSVSLRV